MAHVHPGLLGGSLAGYRPVASRLHSACLSLPCAGKYVFRGLQSTRSTHSTEHLQYEALELQTINPTHGQTEGGDHPGTNSNTIINGGGHPYARHPPGYPRGRPGGVISPHTSPVNVQATHSTVQSAAWPHFYRQGASNRVLPYQQEFGFLNQPLV